MEAAASDDISLPFDNAGTVTVASGAALGVNSYNQSAGSTVLNGGTINGGPLSIDGGALSGTGTINAPVNNGGQVIAGGTGAAGVLTINGGYTQTSAGSLELNIGGLTAGSQYSQLAVSGTATLGGAVDVALINAFQPALGDTFQPLTFALYTGNFGFYNGIVLGNRLLLDPTLNPTNLTLTVGSDSITAAYTSGDGNFNASPTSAAITQTVNKDSTTTSVSASPTFANVGQNVSFTAMVSVNSPGSGTPTGPVDFYDTTTSTDLTPGGVSLSSGTATFSTTSLPARADEPSGPNGSSARAICRCWRAPWLKSNLGG
jgi:hypothetical protein